MTFKNTLLILNFISVVKLTKTNFEGFIVGGEISNIDKFPYSAFISVHCGGDKYSTCGASILNQALLLTAAHCLIKCNNTLNFNIKAYTGSEHKFRGFQSNVISFKIHEKYNDRNQADDIALLELEKDLELGKTVKKVALMKEPPKYTKAVVAGWGWIDSIGNKSDVLKNADQRVLSRDKCTSILRRIPKGMICGQDLKSYPERGDSGSALVVHNFIQIGIVSFKKRHYSNNTVVYTNVPYYYDWIVKNAQLMQCGNKTDERTKKKLKTEKEKKRKEKKRNKKKYGPSMTFQ